MLTIISLIVTVALLLYSMNHLDESGKCIIANLTGGFINLVLMIISMYAEESWGFNAVCAASCMFMSSLFLND
jgi:hypothetical protein